MTKEQTVSERKRLYDAICALCGTYLLAIEELLDPGKCLACPEEAFRARLKEALVAGVLVKRTANLLLMSGETDMISPGDVRLSVKEALDTAHFAGYDVSLSASSFLEDNGKETDAKNKLAAFCAFADALAKECLEDYYKTARDLKETTFPETGQDVLLAVKQKIHADMGGVLVASRAYLSGDKGPEGTRAVTDNKADDNARAALVSHWQRVLHTMRTGEWDEEHPDVGAQILAAADAAGVKVTFVTAVPEEDEAVRRYVKDASAKIVAAVRAGERALTI
ncbi:MAG: hypothetical protein IJQ12_09175 [Lachnospiraceae bacterium]|nr:hypothetical protein [Lachnospiraceae bacterium]